MLAKEFVETLKDFGVDFFTGVPDSLLKPFLDEVERNDPGFENHITAVNEGAAAGLAAGYYMSEGKAACIYLQNSGIGNLFNPICSLMHEKVYGIPALYIVGWRGEPGVKDEPQHVYQGEITLESLDLLGIAYEVVEEAMDREQLLNLLNKFRPILQSGKGAALVIKKGALTSLESYVYQNPYQMKRERAIELIVDSFNGKADFLASTGKISRELYEIREQKGQSHETDFLTVGSMGHCSSIAVSIAKRKPNRQVICLDGDGALLMHMGALATIGSLKPGNFLHVLLDNGAHETVGGLPTVSPACDICGIAIACGYDEAYEAETETELMDFLEKVKREPKLTLIRIRVSMESRTDLGRPKETPGKNLDGFMARLKKRNH